MEWLDLVGWAGSALLVWSLLQTRILRLRVINLIGSLVLVFFNGALRVWPMVGLNVVLSVINVFYLRRQPFLHFHLLSDGRRRADVKTHPGWSQLDIPRPISAARRLTLLRALRAVHRHDASPARRAAR